MFKFSSHSLKSLVCLNSSSVFTLKNHDKYLAKLIIFYCKKHCKMSLLNAANSQFLVPLIFFLKYDMVKLAAANLSALGSKSFIWDFYFSIDHGPPVVLPWQLTPQSFNDASEPVFIWGGQEIKDLPLHRVKFSFHNNSSFFASTRIINFSSKKLRLINFWICWCWR